MFPIVNENELAILCQTAGYFLDAHSFVLTESGASAGLPSVCPLWVCDEGNWGHDWGSYIWGMKPTLTICYFPSLKKPSEIKGWLSQRDDFISGWDWCNKVFSIHWRESRFIEV